MPISDRTRWDRYFFNLTNAVAQKSSCYSRKIGSILVKDKAVISSGYNGPARGIPDCSSRFMLDPALRRKLAAIPTGKAIYTCPRRILGFGSGEGLEYCYAIHSECNSLLQAARSGVSTKDAILYMNWISPCQNCIQSCINAGIKEIVVTKLGNYNEHSQFILEHTHIKIREFELE